MATADTTTPPPPDYTGMQPLSLRRPEPNMSPVSNAMRNSQLDEGFSEETRSMADSDMIEHPADEQEVKSSAPRAIQAVLDLSPEEKMEVAKMLIHALPNGAKEELKALIERLTHFNPANYLPYEIVLQIFSYLSPRDLLSASTIDRAWRLRAQDEKLWRGCFKREGWVLEKSKMESFEQFAEKKGKRIAEGILKTPALERRSSRKRVRAEAFGEGEAGASAEASETEQVDILAAQNAEDQELDVNDDFMEGVEANATASPEENIPEGIEDDSALSLSTDATSPSDIQFAPPIFQPTSQQAKLSWAYLYKQRRRLESNWEEGKFKMFQLPHRDYPEEGHSECVYTIQHTTRHLVSGSRDRTIRIWDLETNRLKGNALHGHEASVLCLQFDERPEHDIIVSGGSDAYVIVWRFSTGAIIKKMTAAHTESVLNLRFDDRYIVTCSKDKTIKVWSRNELDRDSDVIPAHVLPNFATATNDPTYTPRGGDGPIPAFTLLTTFHGHHAAVNAVMILNNTIVSASGDRTIKAWDLSSGYLKKNYVGHTKGIACVQFDGRRIVSGSSDNTVRIFDAEQQAEVACLTGHRSLVRTVQARFGDLDITTDEELEAEARRADEGFMRALDRGVVGSSSSSSAPTPGSAALALRRTQRAQRNAGSSRPEDMISIGTKVPPGGGGSRWAKIVSGSYDEDVIVWKRDAEGNWCQRLRLTQDPVNRAANRRTLSAMHGQDAAAANAAGAGPSVAAQQAAHQLLATAQGHLVQANSLLQPHLGLGGHHLLPANQLAAMANAQNQLGQQLNTAALHYQHAAQVAQAQALQQQQQQQNGGQPAPQQQAQQNNNAAIAAGAANNTANANAAPAQAGNHVFAGPPPQLSMPQAPAAMVAQLNQQAHATPAAAAVPQAAAANQPAPTNGQQANAAAPAPAAATINNVPQPGAQAHGHAHAPRESNRVFKLQFDARRIICCSQNKVIVGWDFANGDPELERIGEWSVETA